MSPNVIHYFKTVILVLTMLIWVSKCRIISDIPNKDYKFVCYYVRHFFRFLRISYSIFNLRLFLMMKIQDARLVAIHYVFLLYPEDIDPTLCTHLIFGFANLNNQSQVEIWVSDLAFPKRGSLKRRFQVSDDQVNRQ